MAAESLADILEGERIPYRDKVKFYAVLGLLLSGRISLGKASDLLGIRIDELWEMLDELGIRYQVLDYEEVEREVESYKRIFKGGS